MLFAFLRHPVAPALVLSAALASTLLVSTMAHAQAEPPAPAPEPETPAIATPEAPPPEAPPPATPPPPAAPPPGAYPPGYGPPPGYYPPPPGYGPPPGYYPPGYYPEPPEELPYEEGAAIPPGYRQESKFRKGLIIAGACVFGGVYLVTVIMTSTLDPDNNGETTPLYIPVVGPFIAIATIEEMNTGIGVLLGLNGLAQAGGIAMFIAGFAAQKQVLVRTYEAGSVEVTPYFGPGGGALAATVRF